MVLRFQSTHPRRVWPDFEVPYKVHLEFQSTHPRRVWRHTHSTQEQITSFNPHTHEGCDALRAKGYNQMMVFQSTHPRRVWLDEIYRTGQFDEFQSTHPRRVWQRLQYISTDDCMFQSTHPRRVWLRLGCAHGDEDMFQSTHPRRVWLLPLHSIAVIRRVSIHTPTKGVTVEDRVNSSRVKFQSTHPRRVWLYLSMVLLLFLSFNPHTHEGCDSPCFCLRRKSTSFNPHTHEGCDAGRITK